MQLAGRLDRHVLDSRLLRDNPLGDPWQRELFVYVPASYREAGPRLPTVMLLAGYGGSHRSLLGFDPWEPNVVERFDRLVQAGRSKPAILVLPDAINRWGGSQFIDSTATGPYQSYLADEIVDFVDQHYRTLPVARSRAVAGRSSGGFGALRLGLDRPDRFGVIGSHAGDCDFAMSILPELRRAAITIDRAGGPEAFVAEFERDPRRGDFLTMMVVAYAAAYAPEPAQPAPHAALPFELGSGQLLPDVWQRFLRHDPLVRVEEDPHALKDAALVFLDAGDHDEHGLHFGARRLAQVLKSRAVAVEHEEFVGGHRGTAHRYEVSLPRLIDAAGEA